MPVFVSAGRQHRIDQTVKRVPRPRGQRNPAQSLRLLVAEAGDGKLDIRGSEHRIELPGIELYRVVGVRTALRHEGTHVADIQLLGLPWQQTFFDLLGKPIRIGGRAKRFLGQDCRRLMMSVPIALGSRESRHQHIRAELPNHPHNICERNVMSLPLLKCFLGIFRIAEVRYPREALLDAVVAVGGQHFERAQHAQLIEQVAAGFVLPAFAAGQGQQGHGRAPAPRLERQHAAVFVIGMRIHLQQPRRGLEPPQGFD